MSRVHAYEREPRRRRLEVRVVAAGEDRSRSYVELDDTILYPEGGGQPADRGELQRVARRFAASPHPGLALLTASNERGSLFVVAAGDGCRREAGEAGGRVAEALGGRGGGSGKLFQGKASSLAGRPVALEALRSSQAP